MCYFYKSNSHETSPEVYSNDAGNQPPAPIIYNLSFQGYVRYIYIYISYRVNAPKYEFHSYLALLECQMSSATPLLAE